MLRPGGFLCLLLLRFFLLGCRLPLFLFGQAFGRQPGFLCLRLRRVTPSDVALQILQQMLAGGLEFIPDQPKPQQPGAEGIFFILLVGLDRGCAFLHKRLMADGKAKLDIRFHLSGMKGGIEQAEFDGAFGEDAVQVKGMIPALVVMETAVAAAVVPQPFHLGHGGWPFVVQIVKKAGIRLLAVTLPADLYL